MRGGIVAVGLIRYERVTLVSQMDSSLGFITDQLKVLTSIASPTGYTRAATDYLMETLRDMGFGPERSNKGNVLVELGGEGEPLVLASHVDTLGAMVRSIKDNGRLGSEFPFLIVSVVSLAVIESSHEKVVCCHDFSPIWRLGYILVRSGR